MSKLVVYSIKIPSELKDKLKELDKEVIIKSLEDATNNKGRPSIPIVFIKNSK